MGRDRRLTLAGSGTGDHNRAQPPFEIGEQDRIAYRPDRLFEIGGRTIVSFSISALSGLGYDGGRRDGRYTLGAVSYTHLDVYKRQGYDGCRR